MSRREKLRLLDILDAIDRIVSYVEGMTYEAFLADRKTQDAVTRNIEIIGEAARAERHRPSVLRNTARCGLGRNPERVALAARTNRQALIRRFGSCFDYRRTTEQAPAFSD
jgi:hypothetical protein